MKDFFKKHFTIIGVAGIAVIVILCNYIFVQEVSASLTTVQSENAEQTKAFEKYKSEMILELEHRDSTILTMKERLSIVDEAVNSKDKRASRIKHVREAILDTIKENRYPNKLTPYDLAALSGAIVDASEEFDVPKNLILAIMTRESAFNPLAVSNAKPHPAQGLMQIIPATAKECADDIGKRYYDSFSIRDNVRLGTYYIWKMLRRFDGNLELAIRAYNAGPTLVSKVVSKEINLKLDCDNDKKIDSEYPCETKAYVVYVLDWKRHYEKLGL